jgi:hypothetical protein
MFYIQTGFWYCYAKIIYDINQKGGIHANTKLYEVVNEELHHKLYFEIIYYFYIFFWPLFIFINIVEFFLCRIQDILTFLTKKFIRFYVWLIT